MGRLHVLPLLVVSPPSNEPPRMPSSALVVSKRTLIRVRIERDWEKRMREVRGRYLSIVLFVALGILESSAQRGVHSALSISLLILYFRKKEKEKEMVSYSPTLLTSLLSILPAVHASASVLFAEPLPYWATSDCVPRSSCDASCCTSAFVILCPEPKCSEKT